MLLFICYQLLPTEINGKNSCWFQKIRQQDSILNTDKILQMPPTEGGIQTQRVQRRDLCTSSGEYPNSYSSSPLHLLSVLSRMPRHLLCRGQWQGAVRTEKHIKIFLISLFWQKYSWEEHKLEQCQQEEEHRWHWWHLAQCHHSLKNPGCPSGHPM